MGRHSSPEQGHFYRSFFGWAGLWAMVAITTGVAVWFLVAAIGGPETTRPVAAGKERDERADDPEPTVSGARVAQVTETAHPVAEETSPPVEDEADSGGRLITEGVTVQVLNGTMDDSAAQAMADKLGGLGFSVLAVEESRRLYSETTVFWSTTGSEEAATRLADRFGWLSELKPGNLSDSVSIHVVVGADQAP